MEINKEIWVEMPREFNKWTKMKEVLTNEIGITCEDAQGDYWLYPWSSIRCVRYDNKDKKVYVFRIV